MSDSVRGPRERRRYEPRDRTVAAVDVDVADPVDLGLFQNWLRGLGKNRDLIRVKGVFAVKDVRRPGGTLLRARAIFP